MSFCPTNDGPRKPGRPRRRRTAADFPLPPLPAPAPRPDRSWQSLAEFAGRHVDPDDGAALLGLAWQITARLARCTDAEAAEFAHDFWRVTRLAAERQDLGRLREVVLEAVRKLHQGFPTPAEQTRRQQRARRLARQERDR